MKGKILKFLVIGLLISMYIFMMNRAEFKVLLDWTKQNLVTFIFILFILKTASNILPFVPASFFTLAAIPLIGWLPAYLINLSGGLLGAAIAYWIGKKYGLGFIKFLFGEGAVNKLNHFEFKEKNEFEAVFVIRLLMSQVSHILSYAAGIKGVSFVKYFWATTLAGLIGILMFFAGGNASSNRGVIGSVVSLLILMLVMFVLRRRYFKVLPPNEVNR